MSQDENYELPLDQDENFEFPSFEEEFQGGEEPTLEDQYFNFPEEREEKSPAQEGEQKPAFRRHRAKRAQKKNPVFLYLVILFAVAFLLLLMSFFSQQRDHDALEKMNAELSASMGTQEQTIADLQKANEELTLKLEEANKAASTAESAGQKAKTEVERAQKTALAVEYLAQMERACRTSYLEGYRIAKEMESKGLREYLPTTSTASGCPSPARVYQELCNTLFGNLG